MKYGVVVSINPSSIIKGVQSSVMVIGGALGAEGIISEIEDNVMDYFRFKDDSANEESGETTPKSPGQLQKQVEKGQVPKEVDRVDKPHVPGQKPHVHLDDGTSLNNDGTVHDKHKGNPNPSNKTKKWLNKNGWKTQ